MHSFEVGKPYNPARRSWPANTSQYSFRGGQHELTLFFADPSRHEVDAVRKGAAEFALAVEPPLIVLGYRFGLARGIPWSDCPYSYHLLPPAGRVLPIAWEEGSPATRALLHVFLVDAGSGIIRAMRQVTFSPEFTRAIHRAIWEQAHATWDAAAYDRALEDLYRRCPTSEALVAAASARTKGGA